MAEIDSMLALEEVADLVSGALARALDEAEAALDRRLTGEPGADSNDDWEAAWLYGAADALGALGLEVGRVLEREAERYRMAREAADPITPGRVGRAVRKATMRAGLVRGRRR